MFGSAGGRLGRKKDWNESVLSKRQTELGMAGDLKGEEAITSFIGEIRLGWPPDGQSAHDERAGCEAKNLRFALLPNQSYASDLAKLVARNQQVAVLLLQMSPARQKPSPRLACRRSWDPKRIWKLSVRYKTTKRQFTRADYLTHGPVNALPLTAADQTLVIRQAIPDFRSGKAEDSPPICCAQRCPPPWKPPPP